VLTDLYGPRDLLRRGLMPAELILGHPGFLRQCDQIRVPGNQQLITTAVDLARDADGRCTVLADHAQAPSGAGYALENRVVASQCLPELFAQRNVRRLASFFRAFSERFLSLSSRDQPQAVFLSPGPSQQTYFEHAYLARYLGFSVVEGSDLTVRDDRVFMKTVEGLKPVDLIMRRISAELCDPLELRTDSLLGVPGLLQAARAGRVTFDGVLKTVESRLHLARCFREKLVRVPLDPRLTRADLIALLRHAGARALVTQAHQTNGSTEKSNSHHQASCTEDHLIKVLLCSGNFPSFLFLTREL